MPRIITKRERTIVYIATTVIISLVVFNFIIDPLFIKSAVLNREIGLAKAKLIKYNLLLANKQYIQSDYSQVALSGKTSFGVLAELENLARDSGIRILNIRPQQGRDINIYKEMIIDLRTLGAQENYMKFIYNIESSPFLLKVIKLQFNTLPNSPDLEGSFSISQITLE